MTGKALVGRVSRTPWHFREGLEAALRAEPYTLAVTKPRTVLGMMVKELALDAARGEIKAVQLVLTELAADPEKGSQGRSQAHSEKPTCASAEETATGGSVPGRGFSKKGPDGTGPRRVGTPPKRWNLTLRRSGRRKVINR